MGGGASSGEERLREDTRADFLRLIFRACHCVTVLLLSKKDLTCGMGGGASSAGVPEPIPFPECP